MRIIRQIWPENGIKMPFSASTRRSTPFCPTAGESVRFQLSNSLSQLGKSADKIGLDVPLEKFSAMLDLVPDWIRGIEVLAGLDEVPLGRFPANTVGRRTARPLDHEFLHARALLANSAPPDTPKGPQQTPSGRSTNNGSVKAGQGSSGTPSQKSLAQRPAPAMPPVGDQDVVPFPALILTGRGAQRGTGFSEPGCPPLRPRTPAGTDRHP